MELLFFGNKQTYHSKNYSKIVKTAYFSIFIIIISISIILLLFGVQIWEIFSKVQTLNKFFKCPKNINLAYCTALIFSYRASMTLMIIHLLIIGILFFKGKIPKMINEKFFLFKFILVMIGIVFFYFTN